VGLLPGREPRRARGAAPPREGRVARLLPAAHGGEAADVVVSYAGIPLANGRTPTFELGDKDELALPVEATSAGWAYPAICFAS
jgi:hypothetical protein